MFLYFDNAATTQIKPEVLEEMMPYLTEEYGNPSSLYSIGRKAKRAIEHAREQVANLINCEKNEIYFTGGGSESDNTAIKGVLGITDIQDISDKERNDSHIITTKIEHHAVLESCKTMEEFGAKVTYLNVNEEGIVNIEELKNSITDKTKIISIMFANNEIGTIQPIEEISRIAKERNIIFHTDAVQAVGNIPIDVKKLNIDMLSISGHKINAPKGVGALYIKKGIKIRRYIDGGHQEKNMRAGTENLASIVGLGKACEIAKQNLETHSMYLKELKDYYINQVTKRIENIKINGSIKNGLPGIANISFNGVDATALLLELDKKGICVSSGSACNSSETNPSHVLTAIGLNEEQARSAIRVSFGECNTKAQVDCLVNNLQLVIDH